MRPSSSALRRGASTASRVVFAALSWLAGRAGDATRWAGRTLRAGRVHLDSDEATGNPERQRAFGVPIRRTVRTALLGRRLSVALLASLLAVPLAVGSAWWVESNVGYGTLVELVAGTYNGTNPELGVFVAAAVLVALGTVSGGLNAGLLPTNALVVAPVFGAALTRYGTTLTRYDGVTAVVSLPEAVVYAASVGTTVGVPMAVCGFLLGTALRHVGGVVIDSGGPSRPAEQA